MMTVLRIGNRASQKSFHNPSRKHRENTPFAHLQPILPREITLPFPDHPPISAQSATFQENQKGNIHHPSLPVLYDPQCVSICLPSSLLQSVQPLSETTNTPTSFPRVFKKRTQLHKRFENGFLHSNYTDSTKLPPP
jgi:hypothetical protein